MVDTSCLNRLHFAELTRLNERLQTVLTQLGSLTEEKSRLETENGALQNDLQQLHILNQQHQQDYQNFRNRARAKVAEQAKHNQDLEQRLLALLAPMDEASLSAYNQRLGVLRSNEEMEVSFKTERASMTQEIGYLKDELQSHRQETLQLRNEIQTVQTELEKERGKNDDARNIIEALNVDHNGLMDELDDLKSSLSHVRSLIGDELTPRRILAMKIFGDWFPTLREQPPPNSLPFLQSHVVEHLNSNHFDLVMTDQAHVNAFLASIAPRSTGYTSLQGMTLLYCHVCKRAKFNIHSPTLQNRRLNEFPSHFPQTACCQSSVCTACLTKSLKITEDWWYDIVSQSWLKCPVENCRRSIGIRSAEEIANILFDSGEQDIEKYTEMLVARFTSYHVHPQRLDYSLHTLPTE
jgi:predicted  nucleic acid-binding Zn-ribbon protein